MRFFAKCRRNFGDGALLEKEQMHDSVRFTVHKFNSRPKPEDKRRILIITCFSEFGCESIGLQYCIPRIIAHNPGAYVVCVGWWGREYLYRHLADEYWEIEEDCMHLRDFSNAFISSSKNIKRLEKRLGEHGLVFKGSDMGGLCVGSTCRLCRTYWGTDDPESRCPTCMSAEIDRSILSSTAHSRKFAVQVPRPSMRMQKEAQKYLGKNPVGVFARGRLTYGRNLGPDFYKKLIEKLQERGYTPIWLGEKQSTIPCPVDGIVDFSRMPEARDLELTLAIVCQLKFTVQFWTASTRLASMMGVPWILFETPDQIVGNGQEGKRIVLTTDYNKKKLVIAHYFSVVEEPDRALGVLAQAIDEMNQDNWDDILGLVEDEKTVNEMLKKQKVWRDM